MYTAFEKTTVLRDLWGFKQGDLKDYVAPDSPQLNGVRRALDTSQLTKAKADQLVEGLMGIKHKLPPRNLDKDRLSSIFQRGSDFEFFSYLAELSDDANGRQPPAATEDTSRPPAALQQDDSFITEELFGLPDGKRDLEAHGRRVFPSIMGKRNLAELGESGSRCTFLYRLGVVPVADPLRDPSDFDLKYQGLDPIYVIKRVPGIFRYSAETPHRLYYSEYYEERLEGEATTPFIKAEAQAYVYAQERFLTIFSRDSVAAADATPSLLQLNWERFRVKASENTEDKDLIPGVLAGESDVPLANPVPTAYRTLVRLLPPEVEWKDIQDKSRTLRLTDCELAPDEKTYIFNGIDRLGKEEDDPAGLGRDWAFYFERLNVIRNPIDLLMCQRAQYIPPATAEAAD